LKVTLLTKPWAESSRRDEMRKAVLLGSLYLWAPVILAAGEVKPLDIKVGLWEVTTTVTTSGQMPLPPDLMSKLTPEQRSKMEERMKAQSGGKSKTTTRKECITKEKLQEGTAFGEEKKSCTRNVITSTSSKTDMRVECTEQGIKTDGTFQVEALSAESVKGSAHVKTFDSGHTMNVNSTYAGKWIGGTCPGK
jgi:hypothetical protein